MLRFMWWKLKWCLASLQKRKNIDANIYIMSECWILKRRFWFLNQIKCKLCFGVVENPIHICRIKTTQETASVHFHLRSLHEVRAAESISCMIYVHVHKLHSQVPSAPVCYLKKSSGARVKDGMGTIKSQTGFQKSVSGCTIYIQRTQCAIFKARYQFKDLSRHCWCVREHRLTLSQPGGRFRF